MKKKIDSILNKIKIDFGGGCSLEKALVMAKLIKYNKLKTTVDIGVYRGRSLFPQAVAHLNYVNGIVYGVDPYSNSEAKQFDKPELQDQLNKFAINTDFEEIFQEVNSFIIDNGFQDNCILIRKRSDEAVSFFKSQGITFDLIHIDGNHDTKIVISDVNLYLPLLKKNGFIILDDISWESVQPALERLDSELKQIFKLQNVDNDFAVFWNGQNPIKLYKNKLLINSLDFLS